MNFVYILHKNLHRRKINRFREMGFGKTFRDIITTIVDFYTSRNYRPSFNLPAEKKKHPILSRECKIAPKGRW